jgi:hypothetical protein
VTPGIDGGLLVAIRGNDLDSARGTGVAPLVGTAGRAPGRNVNRTRPPHLAPVIPSPCPSTARGLAARWRGVAGTMKQRLGAA